MGHFSRKARKEFVDVQNHNVWRNIVNVFKEEIHVVANVDA
jgi:pyruvate-formate lyase-activating enzyme